MGGCASKPKDSDDKRPAPIPRDDSTSSLKKTNAVEAAAPENKEEGEKQERGENKQNEPPLVDLSSEPKQTEIENTTSEPKTNVSTDSDSVIAQPKKQDKVENVDSDAAIAPSKTQDKVEDVDSDAVIAQPKTRDKVENVGDGAAAVVEPELKQSVDAPTKLEDKETPLVTV